MVVQNYFDIFLFDFTRYYAIKIDVDLSIFPGASSEITSPCAAQGSRAQREIDPGLGGNGKQVKTCAPWEDHIPSDVVGLPRLDECLNSIRHDSIFYHCLPPRNATAGAALSHCVSRVATILKREYPCVFKFGFSHCLKWRWYNQIYGYHKDRDQYQHMVAIFVSGAAIGASLMEAMLIKEHLGSSMDGLVRFIIIILFDAVLV